MRFTKYKFYGFLVVLFFMQNLMASNVDGEHHEVLPLPVCRSGESFFQKQILKIKQLFAKKQVTRRTLLIGLIVVAGICSFCNFVHESALQEHKILQEEMKKTLLTDKIIQEEMQKTVDMVIQNIKQEFDERLVAYDKQMNAYQLEHTRVLGAWNEEFKSLEAATNDFGQQVENLGATIQEYKDSCEKEFDKLDQTFDLIREKIQEQARDLVESGKQVKKYASLVATSEESLARVNVTLRERDKNIQELNEKINNFEKRLN